MSTSTTNPDNPLCECANCGFRAPNDELDQIHDFWSRVNPGEIMPHGQCPECGAFCYPFEEPKPTTSHPTLVKIYSVSSDTEFGMSAQLFATQAEQHKWMDDLIRKNAGDDDGATIPPINTPAWWTAWEEFLDDAGAENEYHHYDEHSLTVAGSPAPAPQPLFNVFTAGVTPPDPDNQNDDRIEWADQVAWLFQELTRCDEENIVCDLITDLAHWSHAKGYDMNEAVQHAAAMFNEETAEE